MPKRNAVKEYGAGEYYHVYNRGNSRMDIFREAEDYLFMLSLFKRYLAVRNKGSLHIDGHQRPNYSDKVELVAYCLMPNHYHLMVYLLDASGLEGMMRSVMTAYSMYFNRKYKHSGSLFEGRFLASRIKTDAYYWQVSRYIHLNPLDIKKDYRSYPYSSVQYYVGNWQASWMHPEHVVSSGEMRESYAQELMANQNWHNECKRLRYILAGSNT